MFATLENNAFAMKQPSLIAKNGNNVCSRRNFFLIGLTPRRTSQSGHSGFNFTNILRFYAHKLHVQLFGAHVLGLYFTGARLLAQKLSIERW